MAPRRLKIAFHVEDLDKPQAEKVIIGPMQTVVELDDVDIGAVGPSKSKEEIDAAGVVISRYIQTKLAGG